MSAERVAETIRNFMVTPISGRPYEMLKAEIDFISKQITAFADAKVKEAVNKATKAHADHLRWRCRLCIAEGLREGFQKGKNQALDIAEIVRMYAEDMHEATKAMGWATAATTAYEIQEKIRALKLPEGKEKVE